MKPVSERDDRELAALVRARLQARQPRRLPERFQPPAPRRHRVRWAALTAVAAIVLKFVWVDAPKWLAAVIGIALGWVGVALAPQLAGRLGIAPVLLFALGGVAYTIGALVYVGRRPNPLPTVFGYHELFHALTVVAVSCQYTAIAFFVIQAG